MTEREHAGGEEIGGGPMSSMEELPKPPGHADLVDALLELTTAASRTLDDLARAPDVPDRDAALKELRHAYYKLMAPISLMLGARDIRAATAVIEAAANVVIHNFAFAPCEVVPPPRRDPRDQHRVFARSRRPRRRGVRE
jgi:hypothetical protein